MPKFDLDWDDFNDSPRVQALKDYQCWWYLKLCAFAKVKSDRPGCVPSDMRTLWQQSGCTAGFPFFVRESAPVIACFVPTGDGWLRHERVVRDLQQDSHRSALARTSGIASRTLNEHIESSPAFCIYSNYPKKLGRGKALTAIEKAVKQLTELKIVNYCDRDGNQRMVMIHDKLAAVQYLTEATQEYAKSPAGNRGQYTPYPASWFNSQRYLDDRREWYVEESPRVVNGKADKFRDSLAAIDQL